MGKHTRDRNFVVIPFASQVALGALAADIVVMNDLIGTLTTGLYIVSIDATWTLRNNTAQEGPVLVGFAHNDLSVTEIAENLAANVVDPSDIIAAERASRPVRKVGTFDGQLAFENLDEGKMMRRTIKFSTDIGHGPAVFAQNLDADTRTTGGTVEVRGNIYARWQR